MSRHITVLTSLALPALLALVVLVALPAPPALRGVTTGAAQAAGLHDPSAWSVFLPAEEIQQLVPWNGRLAGADKVGGLLLLDPAAFAVEVLTTREGLTVNGLLDVATDAQGRLWIATNGGGIVRLDASFAVRRITSLLQPKVTTLAADGDVVFYGTDQGAGRIVGGLPEATYTVGDGLVADGVRAVAAWGGRAWFGSVAGVSEFASNVFTTRDQGLGRVFIYDIVAGPRGVFVATDLGVHWFDDAAQSWVPAAAGLAEGIRNLALSDSTVVALSFPVSGAQRVYQLPPRSAAWQVASVASVDRELLCAGAAPDGQLWLGGTQRDAQAIAQDPRSVFLRADEGASAVLRRMFGASTRGSAAVASDGAGGAWMATEASRAGVTHLRPEGSAVAYNLDAAVAGVGWCTARTKISVLRARDGSLWVSTLPDCVTRVVPHASDDPREAVYESYTDQNSGIRTRRVVVVAQDPVGRLWFLSDGGGSPTSTLDRGIDILLDPSDPVPATSWMQLRLQNSQLVGESVRGVTFGPGGIAWIAVDGQGVQRWDTDGPAGDETLAQTAVNPVRWDLIGQARLQGSLISGVALRSPRAIAIAPDNTLWIGSSDEGLLHIQYVRPDTLLIGLDQFGERLFGPGLLSANVAAMQFDHFGALWVATAAGLNRVTGSQQDLAVDAFTTLPAFDGQLYSPEVISPLPGANVFALGYDAPRDHLLIGTQTGFAVLDVAAITPAPAAAPAIYLYPNPLRAGQAGVRLGGFEGTCQVQIYTLAGVKLLPEPVDVRAGDLVWDARIATSDFTYDTRPVASGLYLVVLDHEGRRSQLTLAIER